MFSAQIKNIIEFYKNQKKTGIKYKPYYSLLIKETCFLPKNSSIGQRFWHILNNTKIIPKCLECNNNVKWHNKKYYTYCSNICMTGSKKVQKKREQTCLNKYGKKNPFEITIFKEKSQQTCLNKYGKKYAIQSKIIQNKIKQTNLDKYGVETPAQSKLIKEKIKQTCLNRYGVEIPQRLSTVKNKTKKTNLKKYGTEYHSQKHLSYNTLIRLKDKEWLKNQHHNQKKTLTQIAKELKIAQPHMGLIFKKYDIKVLTTSISEDEIELIDYIKSIYSEEVIAPTRLIITPLELDIYLPDIKLAIEFNGIYWHSIEVKKDKSYHFNKSKLCSEKSIKLIHIFEDEWQDNKDDIKYWISKYINQDEDFITKDLLIDNINNQKELNLSLNWPINYNKLEELGYKSDMRLEPEERLLNLNNYRQFKIYDCGRIIYMDALKHNTYGKF